MKPNRGRGDDGTTGLLGGERRRKDDPRVDSYGTVDELAAHIGAAAAAWPDPDGVARLADVFDDLYILAGMLARPRAAGAGPAAALADSAVEKLERWTDEVDGGLPVPQSFIRPGGCPAAAAFHIARTVCRRAERHVVALAAAEPVDPIVPRYLNRLSDLLFALARLANLQAGIPDDPVS